MPKLLLFLPCENVIIADNNTTSLITILEKVRISIPQTEEIPEGSGIAMGWYVFVLWTREPQDEGKTYQSRFVLETSDARVVAEASLPIEFGPGIDNFRNVFKAPVFPIVEGLCTLKLFLREPHAENWIDVAQYPLPVVRVVPEVEA